MYGAPYVTTDHNLTRSFLVRPLLHIHCSLGWLLLHHVTLKDTYTRWVRTPLDEWSARHRCIYLSIHNTYKRLTSMSPAGFEPSIPAQPLRSAPCYLSQLVNSYFRSTDTYGRIVYRRPRNFLQRVLCFVQDSISHHLTPAYYYFFFFSFIMP
jgi:hypothetical protein